MTLAEFANQICIDLAGDVAILQQCFPDPRVEHISECNRVIRKACLEPITLRFRYVDPTRLVFLLSADAVLANTSDLRSQAGWAVCAVDQEVNVGAQSSGRLSIER